MEFKDLLDLIMPLLGVLIGGWIASNGQIKALKTSQEHEREIIKQDKLNLNEELKFTAYNTILINSGTYQIHVYNKETDGELDYEKYLKYVRPVLFEVFHLLDPEVRQELINIEYIYESKPFVKGEEVESQKEKLRTSYVKIIQFIVQKYKEQNENLNITDVNIQP